MKLKFDKVTDSLELTAINKSERRQIRSLLTSLSKNVQTDIEKVGIGLEITDLINPGSVNFKFKTEEVK